MMYNLRDLFLNALGMELAEETIGNDREVSGIADNSRTVLKDEVFCCIAGDKFDGHDFAQQAQKEGASCLVVERELKIEGILQIKVNDTRRACARLAAEFYGNPSASLRIIGITGTNGKTTTAGLLAHLLGERTSVIGTLTSSLTTPGAVELQRKLAELLAVGTDSVVLEVSSHALHQYRVEGIKFDLAIFLNLGKDHLDYHANEEEYFCAKARLFDSELSKRALINTDTEWGNRLLKGDFGDKKPFLSLTESVGFSTKDIEVLKSEISGSEFLWRGRHCRINIPGKVNVANAAAALEAAALLGISPDESVERLKTSPTTKGRFEIVELNPFFVVVDFAHTPDALAAVLKSARELIKKGSLKVVFGCGGERDRKKRPDMGRIAEHYADEIYLTSDNSRLEETSEIIAQIQLGIDVLENVYIEPDRRLAIKLALDSARKGDLVLIAGKGHETYQDTKTGVVDFDDAQIVKELLGAG